MKPRLFLTVLIFLLLSPIIFATTSLAQPVKTVGHIGGEIKTVVVIEDRVFLGSGNELTVLDVSDQIHPIRIGYLMFPGLINDLCVVGDYAYVTDSSLGLHIVNIADPINLYVTGRFSMPGGGASLKVENGYAYVASNSGVRIIDISTPTSPKEVATFFAQIVEAIDVTSGYAYFIHQGQSSFGLRIVDISNPAIPTEVGLYYRSGSEAQSLAVSGGYAYIASVNGLCIIDISNPSTPTEVKMYSDTVSVPSYKDVTIFGQYAYIAADFNGLRIIDISNPTNPIGVGKYGEYTTLTQVVAVNGTYAYVADKSHGLVVVDIFIPTSPTEEGVFAPPRGIMDIAVSNELAYVVGGNNGFGMHILDISNPSFPTQIGVADVNGESVAVGGEYVYVATGSMGGGLRIIDTSTISMPVEVGSYEPGQPGGVEDVAITGQYAYIAGSYSGLRIVNISTPSTPVEVGFFKPEGGYYSTYMHTIFVVDNYAFVGGNKLWVVDISNPVIPIQVSAYTTPESISDIKVANKYAYVAYNYGGLEVFDVSGPSNPVKVGSYNHRSEKIDLLEDYVYIADGYESIKIVNVSDPENLVEIGQYNKIPQDAVGIVALSQYAVIGSTSGGFYIKNSSDGVVFLPIVSK